MEVLAEPFTTSLTVERLALNTLESRYRKVKKLHSGSCFAHDSTRGERLALEAAGIQLDYSRNRITDER